MSSFNILYLHLISHNVIYYSFGFTPSHLHWTSTQKIAFDSWNSKARRKVQSQVKGPKSIIRLKFDHKLKKVVIKRTKSKVQLEFNRKLDKGHDQKDRGLTYDQT
jgi:hypothetical protein